VHAGANLFFRLNTSHRFWSDDNAWSAILVGASLLTLQMRGAARLGYCTLVAQRPCALA
jgi:hypothetical protein